MAKKKVSDKVRQLFNYSNNFTRQQWQRINQEGYDFAHDEQLKEREMASLREQGMPTFTINRIMPVVEMLNFYATANNPRWQAVGVEGSDSDVAAVFSDLADYIWGNSDGSTLYSNAVNDAITKSIGYLMVEIDKDADAGMGEVKIGQPEPFDMYVDHKSRDIMFRDASYIMIRKILPKSHLMKLFPEHSRKINKASSDENSQFSYSKRPVGSTDQRSFMYDDDSMEDIGITGDGEQESLVEFFEVYEKIKIAYMNVFYKVPPSPEELQQIQQQVQVKMKEMAAEMEVELMEQQREMEQAVAEGKMIPERFQLEMEKAQKMMQDQLAAAEQQYMSQLQAEVSKIENKIVTEKEFKLLLKNKTFAVNVVDAVKFYGTRIRQSCVAGDQLLYEYVLPENVTEYPVVPFHFKWTGTPFPISAVSPLIGKQKEINKSHQIMVHNASLGSSLRWMFEEGSIDAEIWEN